MQPPRLILALLATLCLAAAAAQGQTIKTLGYNTTNGQVVANTGTNVLTFTNEINAQKISTAVITHETGDAFYLDESPRAMWGNWTIYGSFGWDNTTNAATTRTNLGLGLAALTNDSNVTMMRALSGSTNTNHPFSGTVSVVGTNNTNTLVFSNGILQEVQ